MMSTQVIKWSAFDDKQKKNHLKDVLWAQEKTFENLLPAGADVKRMIAVALNSISKTPKLLNCSRDSILLSIIRAMELGLEPDTPAQLCHLVPFGNQCQLMMGYRGLLKLAKDTKGVSYIETQPVYEEDDFSLELGLVPRLVHRPALTGDRGPVKLYYAIVRFVGNEEPLIEWMLNEDVQRIRNESASRNSDAWKKHPEQMGRKIILKRVCNYIPASSNSRLSTAIHVDNRVEAGEEVEDPNAAALVKRLPSTDDVFEDGAEKTASNALAAKMGAEQKKSSEEKEAEEEREEAESGHDQPTLGFPEDPAR